MKDTTLMHETYQANSKFFTCCTTTLISLLIAHYRGKRYAYIKPTVVFLTHIFQSLWTTRPCRFVSVGSRLRSTT